MYDYYCVMQLKKDPGYFVRLPKKEQAIISAYIDERIEQEKKEQKKAKGKSAGRRRR